MSKFKKGDVVVFRQYTTKELTGTGKIEIVKNRETENPLYGINPDSLKFNRIWRTETDLL